MNFDPGTTRTTVAADMLNARIDGAFQSLIRVQDTTNIADRRHAELAALVQKLTVAVEALEAKVESLTRMVGDHLTGRDKEKGVTL